MDFTNRVKGSVTQALIRSLLEDAGYRVLPFDVEEVTGEITMLGKPEYRDFPSVLSSTLSILGEPEG